MRGIVIILQDAETLLENCAGEYMSYGNGRNGIFEKLDCVLGTQSSPDYLVGGHATAPDFHLFEMLDQFSTLAAFYSLPCPMSRFGNLSAFYKSFRERRENCGYFSSDFYTKLPFNNKRARFGSIPGGGQFTRGQQYDWGNLPSSLAVVFGKKTP